MVNYLTAIAACFATIIGLDGPFFNGKKPTKRLIISGFSIIVLLIAMWQVDNDDKEEERKEKIYSIRSDSLKKLVGETSDTMLSNQRIFSNQMFVTYKSILTTNKKIDSSSKKILKDQSMLGQQMKSFNSTIIDANIRLDKFLKDEAGGNSVPVTIIKTTNSYSGYGYIDFSISLKEDFFLKRVIISILCVDDFLNRKRSLKPDEKISKKDLVLEKKIINLNNDETVTIGKLRANKRYCVYIRAANGEWFQKVYLDAEKYGGSTLNFLSYKLSKKNNRPLIKEIERYTPLNRTSSNIYDSEGQIAKALDRLAQWETQFPIWDGNACYTSNEKIILSDN